MENTSSHLACGLQFAWTHLQIHFQEVALADQMTNESLLLAQNVSRAGVYADGTMAVLVTNTVTVENIRVDVEDHV